MTTKDGGPAFPISEWHLKSANGKVTHPDWRGMTLRDYFAAKALAGMLAYPGDEHSGNYNNNCTFDDLASIAYIYADAMLRAREVTP